MEQVMSARDKALIAAWEKIIDFCKTNYAHAWDGHDAPFTYNLFEFERHWAFGVCNDGTPFVQEDDGRSIYCYFWGKSVVTDAEEYLTFSGFHAHPTSDRFTLWAVEKVVENWKQIKTQMQQRTLYENRILNFEV